MLLGDRDATLVYEGHESMPQMFATIGDHAEASSHKLDLERAMVVLSEPERAAIVQCYHNDLSHEEAAYVLGCPVGTVKTHVLRAKQKLKVALSAWAPEASGGMT
jgi:RNA polymerase sigma-70 factor, ECF subfamily